MDLDSEIRMKTDYEALEAKYRAMEAEKRGIEQQLVALKRENGELKERLRGCHSKNMDGFVDLTEEGLDEEDRVTQLMIENKILECEKQKAERVVKAWESKFRELEAWLDSGSGGKLVEKPTGNKDNVVGSNYCSPAKGIDTPNAAGSASNRLKCTLCKFIKEEVKGDCVEPNSDYTTSLRARRQLAFEKEKSPPKKIAPSTPAGPRPSHLNNVNISDSDDETDDTRVKLHTQNEGNLKNLCPLEFALGGSDASEQVMTTVASLERINSQNENVENINVSKRKVPLVSTFKRKRASNIVMSDSESDGDDTIPIGKLMKMNLEEVGPEQIGSSENETSTVHGNGKGSASPPRRRLVALRKCRGKGTAENLPTEATEAKYRQRIRTDQSTDDDDSDEVGSDSEGESLCGFIVNDTDASNELEDSADGDIDFSEILSNLGRNKERNFKWDFEADMLADFGKDTELCMKAVCALYRQQTSEEKISKETLHVNCRGFNKFDALRGTKLAEFLIAGDPQGDMQKTVSELEQHDPKAVKLCRSLATHYSKQLFTIYTNKEDPLFLPQSPN